MAVQNLCVLRGGFVLYLGLRFLPINPGGSDGREVACDAGLGSITGSGRSPGEGNGSPFQYSCLENPMDRGAWRAMVIGSQRVGQD